MNIKTAYVTGGTGCVGRNIINELLENGWRVIVAHRRSSNLSRLAGLDIEYREVDLYDDRSALDSLPEGLDALFHVAANTSHWPLEESQQWMDNVLATRNLALAAVEKQVGRFILTSTGATYPYRQCSRSEAARIESSYIRTKRLSEIEVEECVTAGILNAVILRPIIVIGAYDYNSYSQIFTAIANQKLNGVFPGRIDFCHARDVAKAHVSAYEKGRAGEAYLLAGPNASWLQLVQKIGQRLGVQTLEKSTPLWQLFLLSYPALWISYLTRKKPMITPQLVRLLGTGLTPASEFCKANKELGYESSSLDDMINDCMEWMESEGMLPDFGMLKQNAD